MCSSSFHHKVLFQRVSINSVQPAVRRGVWLAPPAFAESDRPSNRTRRRQAGDRQWSHGLGWSIEVGAFFTEVLEGSLEYSDMSTSRAKACIP